MPIKKIHGLQRGSQNFSTRGEQFVVTEECLVEAESPTDTISDVIFYLPNEASGPGPEDFNPYQLTFTLKVSTHPESELYYLDSINGMKRKDPDSNFWIMPMTFMTAPVNSDRAQQIEKPQAVKKKQRKRIDNPLNRPPMFNMSINSIQGTTFTDYVGRNIVHTNGLPITSPLPENTDQMSMSWQWNIPITGVADFMADAQLLTNATNKSYLPLRNTDGVLVLGCSKRTLRGTGAKLTEVFETPSGSSTEFHYARVGITFVYTPNRKVDEQQISKHTLQRVDGLFGDRLYQIPINNAGTKATQPWPLDDGGTALSPEEVQGGDMSNVGYLKAIPAPDSDINAIADEVMIHPWLSDASWLGFINKHNLRFPGSRR